MKLCLVASSGGHLMQLYSLKPAWESHQRFWVTFPQNDAHFLLEKEKVFYAYFPTNRNLKNFFKNISLAWKLLRSEKPDAVISTGAGVGVPLLWMGRLMGMRTIYIESLTRIKALSFSGKLVYPIVHRFFVQWPELALKYRRAIYNGQVL